LAYRKNFWKEREREETGEKKVITNADEKGVF